jgi:geranylgeranyl diphosphate synthase type 3
MDPSILGPRCILDPPDRENGTIFEDFALLHPYQHITSMPGKGVRGLLIDAFNLWLHVDDDKVTKIKNIIERLHNASLLIDDIEDSSQLRRGIPVAHAIFGVAHTINCANLVYYLAFNDVCALGKQGAIEAYSTQMVRLHIGQGQDIWWRDNYVCPSENEYKEMVTRKTGGLFCLAIQLMQACTEHIAGKEVDFTSLTDDFAIYFQIRDDYMNLASLDYMRNKDFCEDISEGKYSFPIIHHIQTASDDKLQKILQQRTSEVSLKRYALELMGQTGSMAYCVTVLAGYYTTLMARIRELGGNPTLESILNKLDRDLARTTTG